MKHKKLLVLAGVLLVIIFAGSKFLLTSDSHHGHDEGHGHTEVDARDDHLDEHGHDGHDQQKSSQVTVWDDRFEIFLEHPFIVVNTPTKFVTHVTNRAKLEPRRKGSMAFLLSNDSGIRTKHVEKAPARAGIYIPELTFPQSGIWDLSLIIPVDGKEYVVKLPALTVYKSQVEVDQAPVPEEIAGISFLKEQQWKMPFSVDAVQRRKILSNDVLAVPESALVDEGGKSVAFLQLAGETFEKRYVELGEKENGFLQVLSGLAEGEYVTTKGAHAVAEARHADHGDQGHEGHSDHPTVQLSEDAIERFGVEVAAAGPGGFEVSLCVPGEIVINTDRMAHIVPRVSGIVRQVKKNLGDPVKTGEVMAVIESQGLAEAKATYLASIERFELAKANFEREENLWKAQISSKQEYLDAKKEFGETRIQMRSAEQKLRTLGFNAEHLKRLPSSPTELLTRFEIKAPFNGTVIQKHITLGEVVKDDADVFVVADLDTVWVDLQVHQKDLALIRKGKEVIISAKSSVPETRGVIDYVDLLIDDRARTTFARVVLDNTSRQFRPGTFITASVLVEKSDAKLVVDRSSLQDVHDKTCVFVKTEHGFEPRPVTMGRCNDTHVEITSGLSPGETIVTENSFRLKAEIEKEPGGGQAGHGHAH